jgi:hypothetical protein
MKKVYVEIKIPVTVTETPVVVAVTSSDTVELLAVKYASIAFVEVSDNEAVAFPALLLAFKAEPKPSLYHEDEQFVKATVEVPRDDAKATNPVNK